MRVRVAESLQSLGVHVAALQRLGRPATLPSPSTPCRWVAARCRGVLPCVLASVLFRCLQVECKVRLSLQTVLD